jgi:peptidoglycan/xylan/chitin deacetylase (PgdA/CDA1 family)
MAMIPAVRAGKCKAFSLELRNEFRRPAAALRLLPAIVCPAFSRKNTHRGIAVSVAHAQRIAGRCVAAASLVIVALLTEQWHTAPASAAAATPAFAAAATTLGQSEAPAPRPASAPLRGTASDRAIQTRPTTQAALRFTFDHGGIIRGGTSKKQLALIFTAGDFGDGSAHVLDTLKKQRVKGSFFVTGAYVRKPEYGQYLRRMVAEGHYLGPHSDSHPLYCPWEDREKTLVTREFFEQDLRKSIAGLQAFGALRDQPTYFIPPYEWFNNDQARWAREMGVTLFNFTPGTGSNRDYVPENAKKFVASKVIYDDILKYERKDPHGLNGFLLILHLGADRKDKMYLLLEPLMNELRTRGYSFVRIDELIPGSR